MCIRDSPEALSKKEKTEKTEQTDKEEIIAAKEKLTKKMEKTYSLSLIHI